MARVHISTTGLVVEVAGEEDSVETANIAVEVFRVILQEIQKLREPEEDEEVKRNEVV
ncbi:MAG: hypothetical protein H0Z19_09410 [Archaeoglobus sp.]|uniref:hypothetical protein n=1 Tax=Archaeoglobus sp. TaxID=1872626 RepID=UPI001DF06327|nr:hypothetical protein [Archaeoglobus sp.]MBO8180673.1 hypothetical protein [Archaeoglobus sp.]